MKLYVCKSCQDMGGKKPRPCILTVDSDGECPLYCPYTGNNAKFKQKIPKVDN